MRVHLGKMYPTNLQHQVHEIQSSASIIGNLVNQFKDPQAIYTTCFIPCGKFLDYRCRIWIRRTSADNVPSGNYYVGLFFRNYLNQGVPINGRGGIYFIDKA